MSMEKETTQLLLRIPIDLKAELQRHADHQGRKLTQEINIRLRTTLEARGPTLQGILAREAESKGVLGVSATYKERPAQVHTVNDNGPPPGFSDLDRAMLQVFHALPVEKQLALLSLFK